MKLSRVLLWSPLLLIVSCGANPCGPNLFNTPQGCVANGLPSAAATQSQSGSSTSPATGALTGSNYSASFQNNPVTNSGNTYGAGYFQGIGSSTGSTGYDGTSNGSGYGGY